MTKAVLSAMIRPLVEPRLPDWVEPLWFASKEQALEFAPEAEIGWFDLNEKEPMVEIAYFVGNEYYLVVSECAPGVESDYGRDSDGNVRPWSPLGCP